MHSKHSKTGSTFCNHRHRKQHRQHHAPLPHLTYKHNARAELVRYSEQLPHQLWPITQVLLDEFAAHHTQERGTGGIGDCFGQQCLACAWLTIQDDSLQNNTSKPSPVRTVSLMAPGDA